jgi:hypothetical protein
MSVVVGFHIAPHDYIELLQAITPPSTGAYIVTCQPDAAGARHQIRDGYVRRVGTSIGGSQDSERWQYSMLLALLSEEMPGSADSCPVDRRRVR